MPPGLLHRVVATGLLSLAAASWASDDSGRWRISCDGTARSDGIIAFEITPENMEPVRLSISISDGMREDAVARAATTALKRKLDLDLYTVDVYGGEAVLVESKSGTPFGLRLLSNSVDNVTIEVAAE